MLKTANSMITYMALLVVLSIANAQDAKHVRHLQVDPIMGLDFDASKLSFAELPAQDRAVCANHFSYDRPPYYVFAHIKSGAYELFAVKGHQKDDYGYGLLLAIHNNRCYEGDLDDILKGRPSSKYSEDESYFKYPGEGAKLICGQENCFYNLRSQNEEEVLRQLVRSNIQLEIKAYGSDESFRTKLCINDSYKSLIDSGYYILIQEMKLFCREGGAPDHLNK